MWVKDGVGGIAAVGLILILFWPIVAMHGRGRIFILEAKEEAVEEAEVLVSLVCDIFC